MFVLKDKLNSTNHKVFCELYYEYYSDLRVFLNSYSPNIDLIDDILQETFIEIYNQLDLLINNINPKEHIYKVAIRYSKKLNSIYQKTQTNKEFINETEMIQIPENDYITYIRNTLSDEDYRILELTCIYDYHVSEVARNLKKSYKSVEKRLKRILVKLRRDINLKDFPNYANKNK